MDSAKKQLADRLKSANNILVTVSRDPSIDQLAACIGLTLLLNKMNKHSVAVFSGQAPSTIEFLKPEETLEKTTDSLRDFIIALDKDKADKLRYKVEDNVVRIFITPYKTSISQEDLEFSQGDFNVDVVVALGVKTQEDLDEAITAHGRILHDATVASVNLSNDGSSLGTISWNETQASSLSELVTGLAVLLGNNLLDNQIATALLTGIVAETDRFSNDKTSSETMNAGSTLMAAGANQQLVASKLEEPEKPRSPDDKKAGGKDKKTGGSSKQDPSMLSIQHDEKKKPEEQKLPAPLPPQPSPLPAPLPEPTLAAPPQSGSHLRPGAKLLTTDSPSMGAALNANTKPEGLDPVTDPLSLPQAEANKLFESKGTPSMPAHQLTPTSLPQTSAPPTPVSSTPPTPAFTPPAATPFPTTPTPMPAPSPLPTPAESGISKEKQTLTDLEESVHSPHLDAKQLDTARDEVSRALQESVSPSPAPIKALNAQPMGGKLHPDESQTGAAPQNPGSLNLPFDNTPTPEPPSPTPSANGSKVAPPVPPPFAPQQAENPFDNSQT